MNLVSILVPLGICVALPVLIVLIVFWAQVNADNKRAMVLIEAIKANPDTDTDALAKAFAKKRKSPREILNSRLLKGCIFSLTGLVITIANLCFYWGNDIELDDFAPLLILGLILFVIGISFLIVYFVTRKQIPVEPTTDGN